MFMGNMLFDFILHPAFVVFVLIALFAAVVALVIAHRQKQLSAGLKAILISVVVLCVLYLLFMVSLVFLFDSSPRKSHDGQQRLAEPLEDPLPYIQ